jgi:hypothetical protein
MNIHVHSSMPVAYVLQSIIMDCRCEGANQKQLAKLATESLALVRNWKPAFCFIDEAVNTRDFYHVSASWHLCVLVLIATHLHIAGVQQQWNVDDRAHEQANDKRVSGILEIGFACACGTNTDARYIFRACLWGMRM